MDRKETGGPAFPLANSHKELNGTDWEDANGMTLRDYFAAKAMQSELTRIRRDFDAGETEFLDWNSAQEYAANYCYDMADFMLKARSGA